jgi:hypothetical protein
MIASLIIHEPAAPEGLLLGAFRILKTPVHFVVEDCPYGFVEAVRTQFAAKPVSRPDKLDL